MTKPPVDDGPSLSSWPDLDVTAIPTPTLLTLITASSPDTAGMNESLGAIAACEHLQRHLSALQTRHLAHTTRHTNTHTDPDPDADQHVQADQADQAHADESAQRVPVRPEVITGIDTAASELAIITSLTRKQALAHTWTAHHLTTDQAPVLHLVETGRLDLLRARIIDDIMRTCLEPGTWQWTAIQALIVEIAPGKTISQIRAALRKAIDCLDPNAATKRHKKAKRERKVIAYPLDDGMGEITATLTADITMMITTVLDSLADSCRDTTASAGVPDQRSHQQRRADAFTAIFTAIFHGTALPFLPEPSPPADDHGKPNPATTTNTPAPAPASGATPEPG